MFNTSSAQRIDLKPAVLVLGLVVGMTSPSMAALGPGDCVDFESLNGGSSIIKDGAFDDSGVVMTGSTVAT